MSPTTQSEELPITKMLEEKVMELYSKDDQSEDNIFLLKLSEIEIILPQVRTIELSLIEKAKEEEKDRIVDWCKKEIEFVDR